MTGIKRPLRRSGLIVVLFSILLSACGLPGKEPTPTSALPPVSTLTPAPQAARALTICLGEEPNTLYPFGAPNAAARSVMQAVYDGPIDSVDYEHQPVILQKLPNLADGDASISPVTVHSGSEVVDSAGALVSLAAGTKIRPAGCRADECIVTYDGVSELQLDQMIVTFRMRSDLTWSDGTPITAEDSAYAFSLDSDPDTAGSKFLVDRTQTYEAVDAGTLQWWGKPGYIDPTYFTNFWAPAPKHLWSQFSASELGDIDVASRSPIGWGPYAVEEWAAGDHLTLKKNPYYFRAATGLPKFDTLTFRFISNPDEAVSELTAGRCDLLDPTVRLDGQVGLLKQMEEGEQIQAFFSPGPTIEWLGLGILPATYDNGYNTTAGDRQDIFADARTRQAIAMCLDRQQVVNAVLFGLSSVPDTYISSADPLHNAGVPLYRFDVPAATALLDQTGWKDLDGDPSTPRQAAGVRNVAAGTPLLLNYYTTTAAQRRQVGEILSASLAQCGIGVNVQNFSQLDLYAPGPDGLLFGRRFDLIEYAMSTQGLEPPCSWFTSVEIPTAANHWVGTNVSGYKNPDFDLACSAARQALPDEPAYKDNYALTQMIFSTDVPVIPLYFRLRVAAARKDLCHFDLDPTASPLWNIEAFDAGPSCNP